MTPTRALALAAWLLGAVLVPQTAPAAEKGRVITLEQAYDLTLATDQSIRIAFHEVRKAELLPWSALARIGPRLFGRANYNTSERTTTALVQQFDPGIGVFNTTSISRTLNTDTGAIGISLEQPLIDFTVFPAHRFGRLSASAANLQRRFTIRGTLFGLVTAYYEVLKQERLVAVSRESLRLAGEQLDFAQKRANVGEVRRADVLRAQVALETARRRLVESENLLELNRNTLGNVLNLAPNTPFQIVEPPDYPTTLPAFDDLLARAYSQREDLRVREIAIEQDIARRDQVIGQYAPRVTAQFDSGRSNTTGSLAQRNHDWQATVSVSVPFFTGGQREIDLLTAKEQIAQTKLARELAAEGVESEVKQAWLLVRSLQQTLKALHAQVVAAEQGYHDLDIQYRQGTATSVDVLTTLNDLNTARKDLTVETYAYQIALRNLEQVTGIFQQERVQRSKLK